VKKSRREHEIKDYYADFEHLHKLRVDENFRDWIEHTMLNLRGRMTTSEQNVMRYLKIMQIPYIFQAPFVIDEKVYFVDFFLPNDNLVIEVDGGYHDSMTQRKKDELRDLVFDGVRIKVARISNEATKSSRNIRIILSQYIEDRSVRRKKK
jgi:very-short-patch-repair endonuclease